MTANLPVVWLSEQRVAGRLVARIGRRGADLIAEFVGLGTLAASDHGAHSTFQVAPGADPSAVHKLTASGVHALVRHARGKATLHGSAIGHGSDALAFIGPSCSGKSTLAAVLCAKATTELVADDTVAIELPADESTSAAVEVLPTQTAVWLHPDARSALELEQTAAGKVSVSVRAAASRPFRLRALVGLVFDSEIRETELRRLRGQDAFLLVSSSLIRFILDEPVAQLREFDQLQSVIARCPVFELRRPRDLARLEQSVNIVERLMSDAAFSTLGL